MPEGYDDQLERLSRGLENLTKATEEAAATSSLLQKSIQSLRDRLPATAEVRPGQPPAKADILGSGEEPQRGPVPQSLAGFGPFADHVIAILQSIKGNTAPILAVAAPELQRREGEQPGEAHRQGSNYGQFSPQIVDLLRQINAHLEPAVPETPKSEPAQEPKRERERQPSWSGNLAGGINRLTSMLGSGLRAWDNPQALGQAGFQRTAKGQEMREKGKPGGFFTEFTGRGQQAAANFFQGQGSRSELQQVGGMLKSFGNLAGMIPAVGKPIEAFTQLADTVFKSIDKLRTWNEKLREADMRFAEVSGSMASVAAQHETRMIQLGQRRGDVRAPSAQFRQEQADKMAESFAGLEDLMGRFNNNLVGYLQKWTTWAWDRTGRPLVEAINELTGVNKEMAPDLLDLGEWEERTEAVAAREANQGRPQRFAEQVAFGWKHGPGRVFGAR